MCLLFLPLQAPVANDDSDFDSKPAKAKPKPKAATKKAVVPDDSSDVRSTSSNAQALCTRIRRAGWCDDAHDLVLPRACVSQEEFVAKAKPAAKPAAKAAASKAEKRKPVVEDDSSEDDVPLAKKKQKK